MSDYPARRYLVFDVGCIECGEFSEIVGFFATIADAEAALRAAQGRQRIEWTGQHEFHLYDVETLEEVWPS